MSFRSDVSIDWSVSPRIITVASTSSSIAVQDLVDTLFHLEGRQENMRYPSIYAAAGEEESATREGTEGKKTVGTGRFTGIVCVLDNALLAFEARGGPSWENCYVTDGDIVAYDAAGALQPSPLEGTAFVSGHYQASTSPGLVSAANELIEGNITLKQSLAFLMVSAGLLGKTSGAGSPPGPFIVRDLADALDRITVNYDANGNRTGLSFDTTGI